MNANKNLNPLAITKDDESLNLFLNNLPFMYARYEVIRDEEGFIRDSRCIGSNKQFRNYYKIANPIGMLRSEFLTESTPFWNFHATQCLNRHDVETWEYNGTKLGELNVIMKRVDNDVIDVYTINMDLDRKMERERRMEYHEILKAKYLCGVKIWHWVLKENRIYSKDTLYGEDAFIQGIDEDKGYLVWDAEEIIGRVKDAEERKQLENEVECLKNGSKERTAIYVHMHVGNEVIRIIIMMMLEERNVLGEPVSVIGCTRIAAIQ